MSTAIYAFFVIVFYNYRVKKYIFLGLAVGVVIFFGAYWYFFYLDNDILSPIGSEIEKIQEKPLEKYSFENLRDTQFEGSEIRIGEQVADEDEYSSYIFYYDVANLQDRDEPYQVSGLLNVPKTEGEYPLLVQFRGFVPQDIFSHGEGTRRSGQYFASQGFVTLAPDFLGYGKSDMPSEDPLEERFQTYTMALSLLASLENVNEELDSIEEEGIHWNGDDIGIWGHSNGGHIALSVLSLSGVTYPTVLWNPVSKPFPYSIFYYTDEYDDNGRGLRKVIADFEGDYDIEAYSPPNYYSWIEAPIQIHQGLEDREILYWWSEELRDSLEEEDVEVEYVAHPNSDHNLMPGGWNSATVQSEQFYLEQFEERDLENDND